MKLQPSYVDIKSTQQELLDGNDKGSSSVIIGFSLASSFFILVVGGILFLLHRRRSALQSDRHTTLLVKRSPEKPLTLRKPTAIRSPGQVVAPGVLLKKSPSPTGQKSPPGIADPTERRKSTCSDHSISRSSTESKVLSPDVESAFEVTEENASCTNNTSTTTVIHTHTKSSPTVGNIHSPEKVVDGSVSISSVADSDASSSGEVNDAKLGKLHFRLKYNYEKHALFVTIEKCAELGVKDGNHCDPYVKLHLMPDKQHKVKTRVLMKTRNPVYDEEFTFYGVDPSQLQTASLNFMVLSFDRFSRDKIIGEVSLELAHLEFDALEKQISLTREIQPRDLKIRKEGRGELLVSLCYQPAANRLTVVVLKARNLPKMDFAGLCDPYVKMYLTYDGQRIAKKKTHIKKRTLNPVFNESFVFDVPYQDGLEKLTLEFMLLDYERVTKNEVIGKLVLEMQAPGPAGKHWLEVATKPRRQIAEWHKLQYCE